MKSQEERVWTITATWNDALAGFEWSVDSDIDPTESDVGKPIEVCPVAERDAAREALKGAIQAFDNEFGPPEWRDLSFEPDWMKQARAALQPPDGTEAMFTDAWERPE